MSQPSVASFFNTRKRAAGTAEDLACIKNRRLTAIDEAGTTTANAPAANIPEKDNDDLLQPSKSATASGGMRTRSGRGRTAKRIGVNMQQDAPTDPVPAKMAKVDQKPQQQTKQPKLVEFIKKGPLSPRKKPSTETQQLSSSTSLLQKTNEETPTSLAATLKAEERGLTTPTKQIIKANAPLRHGELKSLVKKELNFDEVKTKITRSAKLQELRASLARIQELEKTRKAQEERNRRLREGVGAKSPVGKADIVQLKQFDTIELEVLTSPAKTFKTPTKLPPPTPDKNELMSPRHTDVSKRVLFSPAKQGSPSKIIVPPAYQRFMSLASTSKAGQLPLPYKYRHLIEIFKGLDSVCAMFHNRKECITFKKLKPAVQRMLRKNFNETHLAQIKYLYPEAFLFTQMKMRNYGSTSKADYFQLVISPNVEHAPEKHQQLQRLAKIDEDNVLAAAQSNAMNPHVMTERLQHFQAVLLERVREEHDKFLKSLDPPLSIPKSKVTRWHPDFDLENCPDIERAHLPQPPNVEKYSSARDILSTARNLFNCATPIERAIERYEAKVEADRVTSQVNKMLNLTNTTDTELIEDTELQTSNKFKASQSAASKEALTSLPSSNKTVIATLEKTATEPTTSDASSTLLKGIPKSLLAKIRAKQAAKALDAITRRPSQDQEATNYARLPEMARHLRNVFITERKGVLTLEVIIRKIQNSFRACLTPQEIEAHLRLIAKEVPEWATFHEVRKTIYLKLAKDMDMSKIVERLETVANEKSK